MSQAETFQGGSELESGSEPFRELNEWMEQDENWTRVPEVGRKVEAYRKWDNAEIEGYVKAVRRMPGAAYQAVIEDGDREIGVKVGKGSGPRAVDEVEYID